MDFASIIQTVAVYALPVLFAITLHEAAHGYAALRFGDNTAAMLGRITLNPLKHIDPVGTIAMPLLLYFATSGAFLFGYAKPVPVRFGNLNNPKRDMVWVALAGPFANFVQAFFVGRRHLRSQCHGTRRAVFLRNVPGRYFGEPGDVCFQFISAATARRWTHIGWPIANARCRDGFTCGALGLLHRHGPCIGGRGQYTLAAACHEPHGPNARMADNPHSLAPHLKQIPYR